MITNDICKCKTLIPPLHLINLPLNSAKYEIHLKNFIIIEQNKINLKPLTFTTYLYNFFGGKQLGSAFFQICNHCNAYFAFDDIKAHSFKKGIVFEKDPNNPVLLTMLNCSQDEMRELRRNPYILNILK